MPQNSVVPSKADVQFAIVIWFKKVMVVFGMRSPPNKNRVSAFPMPRVAGAPSKFATLQAVVC